MKGDFRVHALEHPSADLVEFIESVHFGGEGLRYRRTGLARSLEPLDASTWLALRDQTDAVRGSYALASTTSALGEQQIRSIYRGLLAVDPVLRRRGLGKKLVEAAFERLDSSAGGNPVLSFGLIERENTASRTLLESLGAAEVGTLESRLVYRQWPRRSQDLVPLSDQSLLEYELELSRQRAGLRLHAPGRLPAFGLIRGDSLTAAARVSISSIDLGRGGPLESFLHRHAYSKIHAIGKRYNRRAFTWLGIHDPLVLPDSAGAWREFAAALLAHYDMHMALFTLDSNSAALALLQDAGVFGQFARATRQELRLLASGWNLPPGWEETIRAEPILGGPVM